MVAEPGTGKTWSSQQLAHELAKSAETRPSEGWCPILVHVQRLARILRDRPATKPLSMQVLLQYFALELAEHGDWLMCVGEDPSHRQPSIL